MNCIRNLSTVSTRFDNGLEKWLVAILSGLFMFIVLYVYKAYNIVQTDSLSGHGLLFRASAHALLTSLLFFTAEFYLKPCFNLDTKAKFVFWYMAITFTGINLTFLLFNYFWNWTELYWSSYLLFCYEYPLVVLIPIVIARLAGRKNEKAKVAEEGMMVFASENGKNRLSIKPQYLYYLKSADNYVEVFYILNDEIKKHLLRTSLKQIEEEFTDHPHLVRCHRSYIVNPTNIKSIVQTSKGVNLNMDHFNVPVSKTYEADFV